MLGRVRVRGEALTELREDLVDRRAGRGRRPWAGVAVEERPPEVRVEVGRGRSLRGGAVEPVERLAPRALAEALQGGARTRRIARVDQLGLGMVEGLVHARMLPGGATDPGFGRPVPRERGGEGNDAPELRARGVHGSRRRDSVCRNARSPEAKKESGNYPMRTVATPRTRRPARQQLNAKSHRAQFDRIVAKADRSSTVGRPSASSRCVGGGRVGACR